MKVPARVVLSKPLSRHASKVPGCFEMNAYVIGQAPQLEAATEAFELCVKAFHEQLEALGVEVITSKAELRALLGEEAIAILPRKEHYAPHGKHICPTTFVSEKHLTTDPEKVTCRNCLKLMKAGKVP
jgi:hypothetical protein